MQDAYECVLKSYNPLHIKDILLHGAARKAIFHKDEEDVLTFYANLQHAYNQSQVKCKDEEERFELQKIYIKDVVYLFIATVVYDLAASHDLIDKTYKEVEDAQLAMDLEFRKKQLQVIDGGKS